MTVTEAIRKAKAERLERTRRHMAVVLLTARRERKLTQQGLADAAGVGRRSVQRIEAGQGKPGLRDLLELAEAVGVKPSDLLAS